MHKVFCDEKNICFFSSHLSFMDLECSRLLYGMYDGFIKKKIVMEHLPLSSHLFLLHKSVPMMTILKEKKFL